MAGEVCPSTDSSTRCSNADTAPGRKRCRSFLYAIPPPSRSDSISKFPGYEEQFSEVVENSEDEGMLQGTY
jgi:hypothetical protein